MSASGSDGHDHGTAGVFLRFVVHENRQFQGQPVHDWLLQEAQRLGIHGGSAYRGTAGYGRHGVLHEAHFFELAGDLPVDVQFACSEAEARRLLDRIEQLQLSLFYVITPARFGITGSSAATPPAE